MAAQIREKEYQTQMNEVEEEGFAIQADEINKMRKKLALDKAARVKKMTFAAAEKNL